MKTKWVGFSLLIALTTGARAECLYPAAPGKLPNGFTASAAEMSSASRDFKAFNAAITAYTDCIDQGEAQAIKDGGSKLSPDQITQIHADAKKKHDAAVDDVQQRTTAFNAEVRAYKSRQPPATAPQ